MPKISMVAIKTHVYANKRVQPGGSYEARGEGDARLMEALKNAKRAPQQRVAAPAPAPAPVAPVLGGYKRRDMTAEPPRAPAAKKVAAKKTAATTRHQAAERE